MRCPLPLFFFFFSYNVWLLREPRLGVTGVVPVDLSVVFFRGGVPPTCHFDVGRGAFSRKYRVTIPAGMVGGNYDDNKRTVS